MKKSYYSNLHLYSNGEAVVNEVVLKAFEQQAKERMPAKTLSMQTKIFTEGGFTLKDIANVLFQTRIHLLVPFSYDLLLEQHKDATIGSLAAGIWKSMMKAIRYN